MGDMFNKLICTWNEHDLDRLVTLYAEDYEGKDVGLAQTYYGLAGIRQMAQHYYTAFPDLSFISTETIVQASTPSTPTTTTRRPTVTVALLERVDRQHTQYPTIFSLPVGN